MPELLTPQYVGVLFPCKLVSLSKQATASILPVSALPVAATGPGPGPLATMFGSSANENLSSPQSLEQLLECQWEHGSQFLMEQAQHFDSKSKLHL
uniref:Uncharacterized protein n=1 Tax=Glossina palpalis gambiensis TaxID=67801 RepID=A0A1B0AXH9_9MUSC